MAVPPGHRYSDSRHTSANGSPNRNRTSVAAQVPRLPVSDFCAALRPVCARAANKVTGTHQKVARVEEVIRVGPQQGAEGAATVAWERFARLRKKNAASALCTSASSYQFSS